MAKHTEYFCAFTTENSSRISVASRTMRKKPPKPQFIWARKNWGGNPLCYIIIYYLSSQHLNNVGNLTFAIWFLSRISQCHEPKTPIQNKNHYSRCKHSVRTTLYCATGEPFYPDITSFFYPQQFTEHSRPLDHYSGIWCLLINTKWHLILHDKF